MGIPGLTRSAADKRYARLVLDVRDFGVKCDGVTDDTAALNAMLSGLPARAVVRVPDRATVPITAGLSVSAADVVFAGPGATLKLDAGATSGTAMLSLFGAFQVIEGLIFDTSGVTDSTCVRMRGSWQTVRDCKMLNPMAGGVYVQDAITRGIIEGCKFSGNGYGVLFDAASTASSVVIRGNVFDGGGAATGDAIEVNTPTGGATDVVITGNVISGYQSTNPNQGMGIGVANANRVVVSGNTIRDCHLDGVHIEDRSTGCVVSNNAIYNCARSGVSLQAGSGSVSPTNTTISGNTVVGCGWNAGTGGIALEGPVPVKQATITGNVVRACGRSGAAEYYGIDLGFSPDAVVVSGNLVYNTQGSLACGIRAHAAFGCMLVANICSDDQVVKTQDYGFLISGDTVETAALGNNLSGNVNPIYEGSLGASTALWYKQGNRPSNVDGPLFLPDMAGPVTDSSFPFQQPNGALMADSVASKLYMRCGGSTWKSVTLA